MADAAAGMWVVEAVIPTQYHGIGRSTGLPPGVVVERTRLAHFPRQYSHMLKIGDRVPDFDLPTNADGAARLSDLLRRAPVVLYFYPADFTRVCTAQACMFRDAHQELAAAGLTVVGVSPQSTESHERFAREHGLVFILVADPQKRIIGNYGATWPLGLGVRRVTYLIGGDGRIADHVVAELSVGAHRGFVERALIERGTGPARRTP